MRKHWPWLAVLTVSLLTHFIFFGHPNQTVFDEVHFGKFVSGYLSGEYFFDIHPPLGKLLITAVAYFGGFAPEFSFNSIGDTYPNNHYLALRFLPSLAGALLPVVIYFLARQWQFSVTASLLAGLLVALENALLIQSRFILLDSFLLLFGFSSLLFYFRYRQSRKSEDHQQINWRSLVTAGILAALAGSIKWTGFSFLGLMLIGEAVRTQFPAGRLAGWRQKIKPLLALTLLPLTIYTAIFAVHFRLLPKSGPGDAFMTASFQKTLRGSRYQKDSSVEPAKFFKKFTELNLTMYSSNQKLTAAHPYGSRWHTWPFLIRPVYYWNKADPLGERKIYLLGNPLIWWASTVAIFYLIADFFLRLRQRKLLPEIANWILGGYLLNLLPFLSVKRVMFLYHYFPALILGVLALAYLVDDSPRKKNLAITLTVLAAFFFIFFSPLTYGLPTLPADEPGLFWLNSWR